MDKPRPEGRRRREIQWEGNVRASFQSLSLAAILSQVGSVSGEFRSFFFGCGDFFGGVEVMVRGCDCGLVGVLVCICISAFLLVSASVSVSKTLVPLIFNERRASDGLVICQVFQVLVKEWSECEEA